MLAKDKNRHKQMQQEVNEMETNEIQNGFYLPETFRTLVETIWPKITKMMDDEFWTIAGFYETAEIEDDDLREIEESAELVKKILCVIVDAEKEKHLAYARGMASKELPSKRGNQLRKRCFKHVAETLLQKRPRFR